MRLINTNIPQTCSTSHALFSLRSSCSSGSFHLPGKDDICVMATCHAPAIIANSQHQACWALQCSQPPDSCRAWVETLFWGGGIISPPFILEGSLQTTCRHEEGSWDEVQVAKIGWAVAFGNAYILSSDRGVIKGKNLRP